MDIIFKGRRTDVPERFRRYAEAKLDKLGRLDRKVIRVDVEVTTERNPRQSDRRQRVELTIASRGPVIRAEAAADDRYAALDRAYAKLEERLRRSSDRRKERYSAPGPGTERVPEPRITPEGGAQARRGPAGAPEPAGTPAEEVPAAAWEMLAMAGSALGGTSLDGGDGIVPIAMEGDGPLVVREKFHAATPMRIDQALLQMELVGHDFFLFRDAERGHPSVVYRRHGYQYGVIRLVEQEAGTAPGSSGQGSGLTAGRQTGLPAARLPGPGALGG